MIIRHSNKILEQLSEIENVIKRFEEYLETNELNIDREKLLMKILKTWEVKSTSQESD